MHCLHIPSGSTQCVSISIGLRVCSHARLPHPASLPVRVPMVVDLPPASFSHDLADAALLFSYGCLLPEPPISSFHLMSSWSCQAHERTHLACCSSHPAENGRRVDVGVVDDPRMNETAGMPSSPENDGTWQVPLLVMKGDSRMPSLLGVLAPLAPLPTFHSMPRCLLPRVPSAPLTATRRR